MKEGPERIFRGGIGFYLGKVITFFIALVFVISGFVIPLFALVLYLTGEISRQPPSLWLVLLFALLGGFSFWLAGNWWLAFPEIGISKNYLWFRHFGIWQTVRWVDITVIAESQQAIDGGLYVYSERLPIYQRFSTSDLGAKGRITAPPANRKRGRALFISPALRGYRELSTMLPKLRQKAMLRRHQEKRQKRLSPILS